MQLIAEALVVGFIILIIAIPVMGMFRYCYADMNGTMDPSKYYAATVITGMLAHFVFELSGANSWYCNNGVACEKIKNNEEIMIEWG